MERGGWIREAAFRIPEYKKPHGCGFLRFACRSRRPSKALRDGGLGHATGLGPTRRQLLAQPVQALILPRSSCMARHPRPRRERAEQLGERLGLDPAHGPWVCLELSDACADGMRRWLLVRCDAEDPDQHAYFLAYGPEATGRTNCSACARHAGRSRKASRKRRARSVSTSMRCASGRPGTAMPPSASWPTPTWLSCARRRSRKNAGKRGRRPQSDPLTVPEVRRLVLAMGDAAERRSFRLGGRGGAGPTRRSPLALTPHVAHSAGNSHRPPAPLRHLQ